MSDNDILARLAAVIESRRSSVAGNGQKSYVAQLFGRGSDGILKKLGEETAEVIMAGKDVDHGGERQRFVEEMADLWFHTLVALAHYDLTPAQVLEELQRREGIGGLQEKASRDAQGA